MHQVRQTAIMTTPTSPAPTEFPTSLAAAADLTGTSVAWLLDLITSGALAFAGRVSGSPSESLWVSPADVRRIITGGGAAGEEHIPIPVSTDQEKIIQVRRVVRTMIETHSPAATHAKDAITRGTALITKDKRGRLYFCIRPDDVVAFSRLRRGHPYTTLESIVSWALERTGAERVRGIRGIDDESKTWGYWWRLPATLASPVPTDDGLWTLDFLPTTFTPDDGSEPSLLSRTIS